MHKEPPRFLQSDVDALKTAIADYESRLREVLASVHDSTTQSSETWHDNPLFDDVQRQAQMLERERARLSNILHECVVVEPGGADGIVIIGATVEYRRLPDGESETLTVASFMNFDSSGLRVSYAAPLAAILLDARPGDRVRGYIGDRELELEVLAVYVSQPAEPNAGDDLDHVSTSAPRP